MEMAEDGEVKRRKTEEEADLTAAVDGIGIEAGREKNDIAELHDRQDEEIAEACGAKGEASEGQKEEEEEDAEEDNDTQHVECVHDPDMIPWPQRKMTRPIDYSFLTEPNIEDANRVRAMFFNIGKDFDSKKVQRMLAYNMRKICPINIRRKRHKKNSQLTPSEAAPQVPVYNVNSLPVDEQQLKSFCEEKHIVNVTGLCDVLNMNLEEFLPEKRLNEIGHMKIKVLMQNYYPPEYYEVDDGIPHVNESRIHELTVAELLRLHEQELCDTKLGHLVRFGCDLDLHDDINAHKLFEAMLAPLPDFMKVDYSENILSNIDMCVGGVNSLYYYVKTPGCRSFCHQENNNSASININIGPDDCVWYAVEDVHKHQIEEYLRREGLKKSSEFFENNEYWLDPRILRKNGIPVTEFRQKAGDIVYVGFACIHWVWSAGKCANISWNVAPLVAGQWDSMLSSYGWNRIQRRRSLVPLEHFAWMAAMKNIFIKDSKIATKLRQIRVTSYAYQLAILRRAQADRIPLKYEPRIAGERSKICLSCQCELFNLHFYVTGPSQREPSVSMLYFCYDCIRTLKLNKEERIALTTQFDIGQLHDLIPPISLEERPFLSNTSSRKSRKRVHR